MTIRSNRGAALTLSGVVLLAAVLAAGCNKSGGGGDDAALIASGKTVFASNGCTNCHAVGGQGGRKGPDLSHEGAGGHDAAWLTAHVKNPKSHNPMSGMPPFEGKINDKDMLALGAYLASLK